MAGGQESMGSIEDGHGNKQWGQRRYSEVGGDKRDVHTLAQQAGPGGDPSRGVQHGHSQEAGGDGTRQANV